MMETFNKVSDYTLRIDHSHREGSYDGVERHSGYTRSFNFLSRQLTTTHRDWLVEGRGSNAGGSSAIAAQTFIESFDDLPSDAEIKLMHAKLVELGGRPPALEEVLPNGMNKTPSLKNSGLSR